MIQREAEQLTEQLTAAEKLVLIVDDNDRNSKLARDVLESAGLRTLTAATAAEGIALALEHQPDVVLMDVRLPDLDGAEAARRLKENELTARIPVVALSALEPGPWLGRLASTARSRSRSTCRSSLSRSVATAPVAERDASPHEIGVEAP